MNIKKLVSYPHYVWDDVREYVMKKYKIKTPRSAFNLFKYIHSPKFNYKEFVANISERQSMVLFKFICHKLGIGFIPDSHGWKVISLEDTGDELLEYMKYNVIEDDVEEVVQVDS